MSEETTPRAEDAKDEDAKAAPLRPVSPRSFGTSEDRGDSWPRP